MKNERLGSRCRESRRDDAAMKTTTSIERDERREAIAGVRLSGLTAEIGDPPAAGGEYKVVLSGEVTAVESPLRESVSIVFECYGPAGEVLGRESGIMFADEF